MLHEACQEVVKRLQLKSAGMNHGRVVLTLPVNAASLSQGKSARSIQRRHVVRSLTKAAGTSLGNIVPSRGSRWPRSGATLRSLGKNGRHSKTFYIFIA